MPEGKLPRPWTSGSAMAAARMLQMEQPKMGYLYRHASVGAHLDTGQVFTDGETAMDVLRDIFPIQRPCGVSERETLSTLYNEPVISPHSLEGFSKVGAVLPGLDTSPSLSFLVESCARARNLPQGLARHGKGTQAIEFFKEMQQWGAIPDDVTFVYLLSACSHCGLVDEAFCFLMSMITLCSGQAAVIHYDCVIDLLGRVGQLSQAVLLIENMPFEPTAVTWTSLLGACKIMLDIQGGKCAADHLVEVREEGFVPYILLSVLDARLDQIYGQ